MGSVTIGLDVGQRVDPTAAAVCERETRILEGGRWVMPQGERIVEAQDLRHIPPKKEDVYYVRHISRLPLGTAYPAVAERVAELIVGVRERNKGRLVLNIDATGVGLPVVDLIRERLADLVRGKLTGFDNPSLGLGSIEVVAVMFTHGDHYEVRGKTATLGKAFLVSRLQALLQTERVKLPKTPETEALARELQDYQIKVDANANDTYGAFRVGAHDDLVTALGLAVLPPGPSRRLVIF